jgi:phage gp16-like protein
LSAPARKARFNAGSQSRRALIAKVHVAKTQLGLNDDDYRAVLLEVGGATSAADLSDAKLVAVVKRFEERGFNIKARKPGAPRPADHPVALKARALWISLHQLGAIDDPSEAALEAFARRQLRVAKLQWADQAQGYKLIEALKAMAQRAGWNQQIDGNPKITNSADGKLQVLKRRLVDALADRLIAAELMPPDWNVERAAWEFGGIEVRCVLTADIQQLDLIARTFAAKLREFWQSGGAK